jgi:type VI secretion system protein ImpH
MATSGGGTPSALRAEPGRPPADAPAAGGAPAPDGGAAPTSGSSLPTVEKQLFEQGFAFDFFQAVRLLQRLDPNRKAVGHAGPPAAEAVRFRAHLSLSFPPSPIFDIARPTSSEPVPTMVEAFLGLTGPSGVLPRHYTELLLRHEREAKFPEKHALRDWFDMFNHRFVSLFYRAWEKYRFYLHYESGLQSGPEPDAFTRCLFSLIGLGGTRLRQRMRIAVIEEQDEERKEKALTLIDDLVLLHYSGFLAHRPRSAVALEAMLRGYFQLPLAVKQFSGQWLLLDPANQSRVGSGDGRLGENIVVGDRVWDAQSKFRLRLGPLHYDQFTEYLPDRSPVPRRKAFFMVCHLTRFYVGPELDFDVQLVLKKEEVPECQLAQRDGGTPRLGWNTWIRSQDYPRDADEAVFQGQEVVWAGKERPV